VLPLLPTALVLLQAVAPPSLSPFQQAKAESLLRNRLPCLGCHELGGEGGSVGPSLSELKQTRSREYVYSMIQDPQRTAPHTIMPRVPMPQETLELITSYLVQREPTAPRARTGVPASPPADTTSPAGLYGHFCAACHGSAGRGDGYNARFLPVRPTVHADSAYMSRRPDDALFDAVHAGGYIMNRSNRMPPFGERLTREQIRGLVRHMRVLCRCEGPAWSRDDR
jgi:mono/diheme cytochrome c family protein